MASAYTLRSTSALGLRYYTDDIFYKDFVLNFNSFFPLEYTRFNNLNICYQIQNRLKKTSPFKFFKNFLYKLIIS